MDKEFFTTDHLPVDKLKAEMAGMRSRHEQEYTRMIEVAIHLGERVVSLKKENAILLKYKELWEAYKIYDPKRSSAFEGIQNALASQGSDSQPN